MSPADSLEALLARMPSTMAASMKEQLARANLLFPVERRLLDGRLEWLNHIDRADFDRLFAPMRAIESRMQLPAHPQARFSIEQTAIIARSPLYPEWRREVERVFAEIDAGLEKLHPVAPLPRLLICVLPPGLPASAEPWSAPPPVGTRLTLEREFGVIQGELLAAVARRECPPGLTPVERTWVVGCETAPYSDLSTAIVMTWQDTARVRRKFLDRLNDIHRTLHSVDEAMSDLEQVDLSPLLPPRLTEDPRVREFVRTLLLSGNGSLVMNNSFVQWCASEALRRAQPQALVAAFGIRDKPKPFSSAAWFEDQVRANPVPDQPDPAGSLVDGEMLSRYTYLTARRLAPYAGRTVALFAVADRKLAFQMVPDSGKPWPLRTDRPVSADQLRDACLAWLR